LSDSRRPRGERRRQAILDATLTLIGREGAGAVTHRKVAELAGVPLAATTYYFASKDELVREALVRASESDRAELDAFATRLEAAGDIDALAAVLVDLVLDWLGPRRAVLVSHYEISLEGARRAELAEISRAWTDAYVDVLTSPLSRLGSATPNHDAWLVHAMLEGMVFDQLSGARPEFGATLLRPSIERLLHGLIPSSA
jgi:DNA-binding transcriptional regulator YbjK